MPDIFRTADISQAGSPPRKAWSPPALVRLSTQAAESSLEGLTSDGPFSFRTGS